MANSTITITFGDICENGPRMQQIGSKASHGFTVRDLKNIQARFEFIDLETELIELPFEDVETPAVLIIRKAVPALIGSDRLFDELQPLDWDKKAKMRGRVVNKHARWNLCFATNAQEPDYPVGHGRIIPYSQTKLLSKLRQALPRYIGDVAKTFVAEGNYYYDTAKCYIGMHGDAERRMVVGARLGADFPLHFQWYQRSQPVGDRTTIQLNDGDIYVMSDVAVGWNWMKKTIPTVRHAAGSTKN